MGPSHIVPCARLCTGHLGNEVMQLKPWKMAVFDRSKTLFLYLYKNTASHHSISRWVYLIWFDQILGYRSGPNFDQKFFWKVKCLTHARGAPFGLNIIPNFVGKVEYYITRNICLRVFEAYFHLHARKKFTALQSWDFNDGQNPVVCPHVIYRNHLTKCKITLHVFVVFGQYTNIVFMGISSFNLLWKNELNNQNVCLYPCTFKFNLWHLSNYRMQIFPKVHFF